MIMERNEAVKWLKSIKEKYIRGGDDFYDHQRRTAIDYAVSALEQKPKTNADRIRAMSDEELAKFLECLAFSRETPWADPFAGEFCDNCPTVRCVVEEFGQEMEFNECELSYGKCPHGDDVLWWLRQPVEEVEDG